MGHSVEKHRARRRRLTLTVAARRRADHLRRIHSNDAGQVDCVCELASTYFAKRPGLGACNCRKRSKGRPRVACGMCDVGDRDRVYEWRREARYLAEAVRGGRDLILEDEKHWPTSKRGPKLFVVEERDINRQGEPASGWYVNRRYRTEAARDNAVHSLRASVAKYEIRHYMAGEAGSYCGPRKEFRVSAPPFPVPFLNGSSVNVSRGAEAESVDQSK